MPIKDALRTCTCKYCGKKFTMFVNGSGELIFFPESTVRPTLGYFELFYHLKTKHPEVYNLYSFLTDELKENIKGCYNVSVS